MSGNLNNTLKQGSGSDLLSIGPFINGGTFTYGCVAKKGTTSEFSGRKTVQVGLPQKERQSQYCILPKEVMRLI